MLQLLDMVARLCLRSDRRPRPETDGHGADPPGPFEIILTRLISRNHNLDCLGTATQPCGRFSLGQSYESIRAPELDMCGCLDCSSAVENSCFFLFIDPSCAKSRADGGSNSLQSMT